ncbi:MAG: hypothetical protein ACYDC8_14125 [Gammaproteobacteria bacterium]
MRVIALFACRLGGALFLYLSLSVGSVVFGATVQVAVAANFTGTQQRLATDFHRQIARSTKRVARSRASATNPERVLPRIAADGYGLPP